MDKRDKILIKELLNKISIIEHRLERIERELSIYKGPVRYESYRNGTSKTNYPKLDDDKDSNFDPPFKYKGFTGA